MGAVILQARLDFVCFRIDISQTKMPLTRSNKGAKKHFPIFELPRELRDHIYRELLIPKKWIPRDCQDTKPTYTLEPAILQASKRIHEEASVILYRDNTWIMFTMSQPGLAFGVNDYRRIRCYVENLFYFPKLQYFPSEVALAVDLRQQYGEGVLCSEARLLVELCDLQPFLDRLIHVFDLKIFDVELQISQLGHRTQEDLLCVFSNIRGVKKATVTGTILPSAGQELANLMMSSITRPPALE